MAQDSRIIIKDNKGTISNNYGEFSISVEENDTLLISGIQYYNKIIHKTI